MLGCACSIQLCCLQPHYLKMPIVAMLYTRVRRCLAAGLSTETDEDAGCSPHPLDLCRRGAVVGLLHPPCFLGSGRLLVVLTGRHLHVHGLCIALPPALLCAPSHAVPSALTRLTAASRSKTDQHSPGRQSLRPMLTGKAPADMSAPMEGVMHSPTFIMQKRGPSQALSLKPSQLQSNHRYNPNLELL